MIVNSLDEFYKFCALNRPILAIDYGKKKIGVAISTPDHLIAMPHSIILTTKEDEKLNRISQLTAQNNVCAIIIGLPIYMDGTKSAQTEIVINFAKKLSQKIGLPIYLQDERLTSRAADNLLKIIGFSRKKRNNIDDMPSASLILEITLESLKNL